MSDDRDQQRVHELIVSARPPDLQRPGVEFVGEGVRTESSRPDTEKAEYAGEEKTDSTGGHSLVGYHPLADTDSGNLFAHARFGDPAFVPLAERMRPRELDEYIGQEHLTGPGRMLRRVAESGRIPSMILWGPPGTGKTTLARMLAGKSGAAFRSVSATDAGIKELRREVEAAKQRRDYEGRGTLLFVDEIHRFNKAQQDALLPHVEAGVCTLIGATTENPSFEVNAALLSRARVVQLRAIAVPDLVRVLEAALTDQDRGLGKRELSIEKPLLGVIAHAAQGDARRALNALELTVDLLAPKEKEITPELVAQALGKRAIRYDRDGDEHYNVVSAFIKSMRASDPDAAVYWLARMLEAGEDPVFCARRLVIFASEDVGNADPAALGIATAAADAVRLVGLPEGALALTQTTIYLSLAPKSNTVIRSYFAARADARKFGSLEVPLEVRNAVTELMKEAGYGAGYRYPHDFDGNRDPQHLSYLPVPLRDHLPGRRYVFSSEQGWEAEAEAKLERTALDQEESSG